MGIRHARQHLPDLIDRAEAGEEVNITRQGRSDSFETFELLRFHPEDQVAAQRGFWRHHLNEARRRAARNGGFDFCSGHHGECTAGRDSEDYAGGVGAAVICCPIEISISGLDQPRSDIRTVRANACLAKRVKRGLSLCRRRMGEMHSAQHEKGGSVSQRHG